MTVRWAIPLFCLVVFFLESRVWDAVGRGHKIPLVLLSLLGLLFLGSGRVRRVFANLAGKIMPALLCWVVAAYWFDPRSEYGFLAIKTLLIGGALFAIAAALPSSAADFDKLFLSIAAGGFAAGLLGVFWSGIRYGRFVLRDGDYMDPNYYAMWLLAAIPFFWTAVGKFVWLRLLAILPFLMVLRTASRGGMVAIAAMLVVVFFFSSLKTRIALVTSAALLVVGILAFAPQSIRDRFAEHRGVDTASQSARETLFTTGIGMTLQFPLLGVGPRNFGPTLVEIGKEQGQEWVPVDPHNTYLQMASETGIMGFVLFMTLIGVTLFNVISLFRQTGAAAATPDPHIHRLAAILLTSLAAIFTCAFFLNESYNLMVYLWMGLAAGLRQLVARPEPEEEEEEEVAEPGLA